jgi:hypothetical protein
MIAKQLALLRDDEPPSDIEHVKAYLLLRKQVRSTTLLVPQLAIMRASSSDNVLSQRGPAYACGRYLRGRGAQRSSHASRACQQCTNWREWCGCEPLVNPHPISRL